MSPAYDESGITQSVEFAFSEIEPQPDSLGSIDVDAVLEMHNRVWRWVYNAPCKDINGLLCRCIVACWILYEPLRKYNQTEIAKRFGKKKQSLNRWIVSFKKEFPEIGKHLRYTKHTCKKLE